MPAPTARPSTLVQPHLATGVAFLTPADLHQGRAKAIIEVRTQTLDAAFAANPARFKGRHPQPQCLPTTVDHPPASAKTKQASRILISTPRCLISIDTFRYSLLAVKTREIIYLLFEQLRAFLLPILQGLNGRDVP